MARIERGNNKYKVVKRARLPSVLSEKMIGLLEDVLESTRRRREVIVLKLPLQAKIRLLQTQWELFERLT